MKPLPGARPVRASDYRFARAQSPELKRVPWESDKDTFPEVIEWSRVGDGLVAVVLVIAAVIGVLLAIGVIP